MEAKGANFIQVLADCRLVSSDPPPPPPPRVHMHVCWSRSCTYVGTKTLHLL